MMNAMNKGMYVISGDSIADLEAGLAEMKRQIAAGVQWSICGGTAPKTETKKEKDDECWECDDCDCDWDICWGCDKEDCHDCDILNTEEDCCCDEDCPYDEEEEEEEETADHELIKAILDLIEKFKAD